MSVNTFFQELFIKKKTDILRELEQNEQTNYTLRINTIISKDECASLGILNKIDKSKIRDIFTK